MLINYYLAFDIGGTFVKHALIDAAGTIIKVDKLATPKTKSDLLAAIFKVIKSHLPHVKGVGISAPGKIDSQTGTVYYGGSLPFLHQVSLKNEIEQAFNLPCAVSNDGKAATLAELWLGNLKGVTNGVGIILGTGVGGGLVINNQLVQGSNSQAGELSYLLPTKNNHQIGNLVGYQCSAVLFVQTAAQLIGLEDCNDGLGVFAAINRGDNHELVVLFQMYCHKIATLIVNLQAVLDMSTVVIGGGISNQELLIEGVVQEYKKIKDGLPLLAEQLVDVKIEACRFKSEANLLGAIYQLLIDLDWQD